MPELPEVETVCRTIRPHLVGRRLERVDVRERRLRRPIAPNFARELVGRTIGSVERRAKYILIDVGGGLRWVVHLGMSGRLCVGTPAPELDHVHVVAGLEGGASLYYRDPRRFGLMLLLRDEADLGEVGVEPLGDAFSADFLWNLRARHQRVSVKALLMDQRRIAGVGNIYASEALFEAGVRPSRRAGRLRHVEAERLVAAVRAVLERAIDSRGSSLLDYRDADGNPGEYQDRFLVYDRAGQPCRRCGTPIRNRVISGRSSFYCPRCQS